MERDRLDQYIGNEEAPWTSENPYGYDASTGNEDMNHDQEDEPTW